MPSPYQRQLFSCLHRSRRIGIQVLYYVDRSTDRDWTIDKLQSFETVLEGKTLSFLGNSAHYNRGIARTVTAMDADLFIVSDYSAPTAQIAMRTLTRQKKPWIFWGEIPGYKKRGMAGRWIRQRLQRPLSSAAAIAGIGSQATSAYAKLYPQLPTFNIPYFCDLDPFRIAAENRAVRDLSANKTTILFSGQLIDRKGVDVLLRSFNAIAKQRPEINLVLLGDGVSKQQLINLVDKDVASQVHFAGHQNPNDLPRFFAEADLFCLPSRHDGWGVVINEALGSGLPIISTSAVGATADLVRHGKNGLVISPDDTSALTDALERLCDNRDLRSAFAAESARMAECWGLSEGLDRWQNAATTVLGLDSE